MSNPYLMPDEPVAIQFSGGRSSGFMLRQILDAHGGELPSHVHVLFQNTGKERPETLDFIHAVETRWGVDVKWLEYRYNGAAKGHAHRDYKHTYAMVDYETASRDGRPFEELVVKRELLPNPVMRLCTAELKLKVSDYYLRRGLGLEEYIRCVGLRADEPVRVHKLRPMRFESDVLTPMYHAGHTREDVDNYWARSEFDLQLRPDEGNCDLCFLKGDKKAMRIIRDKPELADWWIQMEEQALERFGHRMQKREMLRFKRHVSYRELRDRALDWDGVEQADLDFDGEESLDCHCTD